MRQQRVFRDCTGVNWRVSEVLEPEVDSLGVRDRRSTPRLGKRVAHALGMLQTRAHNLGYLAFDSPVEHRSIQPIPDAWHAMTNQELEDLLDSARPRVIEPARAVAENSRMPGLPDFIRANTEEILGEWENVARALAAEEAMDIAARRDHAKEMLTAIANDLDVPRSDAPWQTTPTVAQAKGTGRVVSGITVEHIVSEFRALRASVLHLWSLQQNRAGSADLHVLTRFNVAVDQAMAESISMYVRGADHSDERVAVRG
jgi:hypothetical protein